MNKLEKEVKIMAIKTPYFMTSRDWWDFNPKWYGFILTDKAPQEAIEDYNHFMERERYNEEHGID